MHSLGFDYELIERLKPNYVVGELAERFLIEPPAEGRSLTSLILEKQMQARYDHRMIETFRRTLPEFEDLYGPTSVFLRRAFGVEAVRRDA